MKPHPDERVHTYDQRRFRLRRPSLSHSLTLATLAGVVVATVGIALFAWSRYLRVPWHLAAAAGGMGQVVIVSVLVMIVLEQRRKRLLRQAQEFTFLNHHIRNAITQITMASYLADLDKQERIRSDAWQRISGALRRIADSADLNGLSIDADLTGAELKQEGVDREMGDEKRTA